MSYEILVKLDYCFVYPYEYFKTQNLILSLSKKGESTRMWLRVIAL